MRIIAAMISIGCFPFASSRSRNAPTTSLHRIAAIAGQESALRATVDPVFESRVRARTLVPDSHGRGARLTKAATSRADPNLQ